MEKFYHGKETEMSFIITRSDLLAPRKEQVDAMMPTLSKILRDALHNTSTSIRLGNVRCVSSKRGWWTKTLRNEISRRGGGGWMVGMMNVGKSSLFEAAFPKGHDPQPTCPNLEDSFHRQPLSVYKGMASYEGSRPHAGSDKLDVADGRNDVIYPDTLLPPTQVETAYPVMPTISHLPGTTASPIRHLFGGGKGELVDLPGVLRGSLSDYVADEYKPSLVMRDRIKAKQFVIKPGQALMLSNLIRVVPKSEDVVLLACPFVSLECHVTNAMKAGMIQLQNIDTAVTGIARPGVGSSITSAGVFELRWDVTRQRAGPLTASSAVGLKAEKLPFIIFSADVLVEGIGWVELAAQVRKKALESTTTGEATAIAFPSVEVFSPFGKHIGLRQPLNAWILGREKKLFMGRQTTRPRRSLRSVKKRTG